MNTAVFVPWAVAFTAGILFDHWISLPRICGWWVIGFLVPCLWMTRGTRAFMGISIVILFTAGILGARLANARHANAIENFAASQQDPDLSARRVYLEGIIKTQPEWKEIGKRRSGSFVLSARDMVRASNKGREWIEPEGDAIVHWIYPPSGLERGDRIRLYGELVGLPRPLNPGQFDYGDFLQKKGIRSIFYAYGPWAMKRLSKAVAVNGWYALIDRIRLWMRARIQELFPAREASVFQALLLGLRKDIGPEIRDSFAKTGTAHILSISGLHVTLIAGMIFTLLLLTGNGQRVSAACSLIAVSGYVFLAGAAYPVQRAGIMAAAVFAGKIFEREPRFLNNFFFAFLIILWSWPPALWDVAFQLSFLSVFALIYGLPGFLAKWRFRESLGRSLAVLGGTFPMVLYYFKIFSPVSLLANLLAIPLFDLAILFALLAVLTGGTAGLGGWFGIPALWTLRGGLGWVRFLSKFEWGSFYIPAPSPWELFGFYAGIAVLAARRFFSGSKTRICVLAIGLAALVFCSGTMLFKSSAPRFEATFFSAGKNDLVHIRFEEGQDWIINTGRASSDQARWILASYLRSRGIDRLSAVMLTDGLKKHTGGLYALSENFRIDHCFSPSGVRIPELALLSYRTNRKYFSSGDRLRIGTRGLIEVLHADQAGTTALISSGEWRMLLMSRIRGDVLGTIEKARERLSRVDGVFLAEFPREASQVKNSIERLIGLIQPRIFIGTWLDKEFQRGLNARGILALSTSAEGAVTLYSESVSLLPGMEKNALMVRTVLHGGTGRLA
ncbi:MAG: ComEC/Rec2 family competence protein [Candidatus Omnitrophota bacterium]